MQKRIIKTIALLLSVLMLITAAAGCGEAGSARQAVTGFVQGMQAHDYKKAMKFVDGRDSMQFEGQSEYIMNAVADSLSVEIISDKSTTVQVKVTSIDLRIIYRNAAIEVIDSFYEQAISGSGITDSELRTAIANRALEIAQSSSAPTVTTTIDVSVMNDNGKWYIILDAVAYNVFTGYMTSANDMMTDGSILNYQG